VSRSRFADESATPVVSGKAGVTGIPRERVWQPQTDTEIAAPAQRLGEYTEGGRRIIRDEMLRRGIEDSDSLKAPGEPKAHSR
jgi:hypothetical protein